ncbi:MAG: hypothetical protein ABR915_08800 [Thermoguttaceae bacterium]|jgi:hypothetical protein
MSQEQVYERTYGTTLQQPVEGPLVPAANEGLLRQVRALGSVAKEAGEHCLKGQRAHEEMRTRKNTHGQ